MYQIGICFFSQDPIEFNCCPSNLSDWLSTATYQNHSRVQMHKDNNLCQGSTHTEEKKKKKKVLWKKPELVITDLEE